MSSNSPEDLQQVVNAGVRDLVGVQESLRAIDHDLDEAIATLRSVTRGATNEAPGRALNGLLRSKGEIAAAAEQLEASFVLAEQWADSLY